jgi:hypothetical protein
MKTQIVKRPILKWMPVGVSLLFFSIIFLQGCNFHRGVRPDCNSNGIVDFQEINATNFGFVERPSRFPVQEDRNPKQLLSINTDDKRKDDLVALNSTNRYGYGVHEYSSLSFIQTQWIIDDDPRSENTEIYHSATAKQMAAGDFDGDGDTDIAVLYRRLDDASEHHYPTICILRNAGDGTFARCRSEDSYKLGDRYTDEVFSMTTIDIDNDNDLDLVWTKKSTTDVVGDVDFWVILMRNRSDSGDAGFFDETRGIGVNYEYPDGGFPHQFVMFPGGKNNIAGADVDGNGSSEIIVAYCGSPHGCNIGNDGVAILYLHLDGGVIQFWGRINIEIDDVSSSLAVSDLNRDTKPDLVISRRESGDIAVLLNTGTGDISVDNPDYFAEPVIYTMGDEPKAFILADMNNDDDPDLVTANKGSDNVAVRLNQGDGSFSNPAFYPTGEAPVSIVTGLLGSGADANRSLSDCFLDIATLSDTDQDITVLWNTSIPPRSPDCNHNGVPDDCDIANGVPGACAEVGEGPEGSPPSPHDP